MSDICFQTKAFSTAPEGDLDHCNGMPGSRIVQWLRETLLKRGYACSDPLQEDYGWGFYVDADGCSIWVSACCAQPDEGETSDMPEWHVGADHDFPPWALRQFLNRRRGQELEREVFAILREMIASHPEVRVISE